MTIDRQSFDNKGAPSAREVCPLLSAQKGTPLAEEQDNLRRVLELRQAILKGEYQIDPMRIADKLVRFEAMVHEALDTKRGRT